MKTDYSLKSVNFEDVEKQTTNLRAVRVGRRRFKRESCLQQIRQQVISSPSEFFENLVTKKQLAQHLGFSESYINKLMTLGLPRMKLGRAVRFRISEVMTWLERRNV